MLSLTPYFMTSYFSVVSSTRTEDSIIQCIINIYNAMENGGKNHKTIGSNYIFLN